jgi:hypothetical protein
MKNLVVISHWLERDSSNLYNLVIQLANINPGIEYSICIVCNHSDIDFPKNSNQNLEFIYQKLIRIINNSKWPPKEFYIVFRENIGMNIGAWDYAWRHFSNFINYLFLQDEVLVMNDNWFLSFINSIKSNNIQNETPFLIGESWNNKWDRSWISLINSNFNSISSGHSESLGRVDFYLNTFKNWGVFKGENGGHLRSLIWFTNIYTLTKINGFRIGRTYGECIASEIATSLLVKQHGGFVKQLKPHPFTYFWHAEWKKDGTSKI